jgi:hypothetical protein
MVMRSVESLYYALLLLMPFVLQAQQPAEVKFDEFYIDQTLRIDFYHSGDAKSELITLDHLYRYGIWAGSRTKLLDLFNNGRYYVKVYDPVSGQLIFSRGFDSYFGEYKTSDQALQGIARTYHESVLMPVPRKTVHLIVEGRDRSNQLHELFDTEINPDENSVIREKLTDPAVQVMNSHISGDPHGRVDLVILGEGYTIQEEDKFKADLKRFTQLFLNHPPYKFMPDKFNIYGVYKPSLESGVDEPDAGIYKNSVLNVTFNSLGSERYLLTEDNKTMHDLAAHVPCDAIVIMVNHSRYGGGGIYNFFCTFTTDNQWHDYLFLHEFGHSFAGLADEYYSSDVAYNEFYPLGIEPVEYNITALLDPKNIKWKNLLTDQIALPTPWEKAEYDSMDLAWQKLRRQMLKNITDLKQRGAAYTEIKKAQDEYDNQDRAHAREQDALLKKSKYKDMVGAFEGAGYSAKGLYRPMLDCIMFSKGTKSYCKVCEQAIISVVEHYTE